MALNTRSILHPKWLTHNRAIQSSLMTATIEVFDPSLSSATYDAVNNTWSGSRTVLWSGKARIQPVRIGSDVRSSMNLTSVQSVEVHLDFAGNTVAGSNGAMADIKPNYQIFITSSSNQFMTGFVLTVRSVVNSSIPWHRVLTCDIDEEIRRA